MLQIEVFRVYDAEGVEEVNKFLAENLVVDIKTDLVPATLVYQIITVVYMIEDEGDWIQDAMDALDWDGTYD